MKQFIMLLSVFIAGAFSDSILSAAADNNSFSPTWKLLSSQDKQQFISGYLHGWRDAAKVIDVAITYVQDNPSRAIEGLTGLKSIYNLSGLRPGSLVDKIDEFYGNPENQSSPLSAAITAARRN